MRFSFPPCNYRLADLRSPAVGVLATTATLLAGLSVPAGADGPFIPYFACVEGKPPHPVFVESTEDAAALADLKTDHLPNSSVGCLGLHHLWVDVPDARMAEALWRVGDGSWDRGDIDYIKTDPEIANTVPDPSQPFELVAEAGRDDTAPSSTKAARNEPTGTATASCGHWVRVWFKRRSTLGFTTYKYFNKIYYCTNGSRITRWMDRYDYWEDPDFLAHWRGQTMNKQGGIGTYTAWSRIQRHVELCVTKFGCYANFYPWIEIRVKANRTWDYSGHA